MLSFKKVSVALVGSTLAGLVALQTLRSGSKPDITLDGCMRVSWDDGSEFYNQIDEKLGSVGPKHAIAGWIKNSNPPAFLLLNEKTREPVRNDFGMIEKYSFAPQVQ